MQTSPKMMQVVQQIGDKFGIDFSQPESHIRLDMPHMDRLCIENIGYGRISVAHYYELHGDLVAEPDVVFFTRYDIGWVPVGITQSMTGAVSYVKWSEDGLDIEVTNVGGQEDLAVFCQTWATNILSQGWLERGTVTQASGVEDDGLDIVFKAAPNLQNFIQQVAEQYQVDICQTGAYVRLDLDGEIYLTIENLGAARVSIAVYKGEGDQRIPNPEIVLWTDLEIEGENLWAPIESRRPDTPWALFLEQDPNGDPVGFADPEGQAELATYAENVFVPNLIGQGWLEDGMRSMQPRPQLTEEEKNARGINFDYNNLPLAGEFDIPF